MPIDPDTLPDWYAQYVVDYDGPGQSGHVQNIGVIGTTDGLTAINQGDCDNFRDTWADNISIFMHEDMTQISVSLKNGSGEFFNVDSKLGTIGSDMVPLNNAYLIRKTVAGGSGMRPGRIYVPGVAEVKVDNFGLLDNTFKDAFQLELDDFMDDLGTHDLAMFVGHNVPALNLVEVTRLVLQPLISNQRRRIRR